MPLFKGKLTANAGDKIVIAVVLAALIAILAITYIATERQTGSGDNGAAAPGIVAVTPALEGRIFNEPVELLTWPGGGFAVAEKTGRVTLHQAGQEPQTLLDLTGAVEVTYEEGLLSIALDPDLARRPFLYAYYSVRESKKTRLSRFAVDGNTVDPESELILLDLPQPSFNYNGGAIRFGPDSMLYLGLGFGGGPVREDEVLKRAQRMDSLYGKIIRIDVRNSAAAEPYRIPEDNPLAGTEGVRGEIYAWGFRNPWRMSFDPETGRLWTGDVGGSQTEEINIVRAGGNYGWGWADGNYCLPADKSVCSALDLEWPIATYSHDSLGGCAVVGGVVYRGNALPWLYGQYLFGDFCSGRIWALAGSVETGWAVRQLIQLAPIQFITSFAEDDLGEVYALTAGGGILQLVPVTGG